MKKQYLAMLIATFFTISTALCYTRASASEVEGGTGYTLNVNTDDKLFDESNMLTGLFFEDINHGADGGLYAELVENRSFEDENSFSSWQAEKNTVTVKSNATTTAAIKLNLKTDVTTGATVTISSINPLNTNNTHYVELNCTKDSKLKLTNDGYKGITVKDGDKYDFSFWARNLDSKKSMTVQIEDEKGQVISESKTVDKINGEWQKYEGDIRVNENTSNAKFAVYVEGEGKIDLDIISLFPQDTWKNRKYGLRKDLVQRLADLKPRFLRFPGGCVVEGGTKDEMYNWKDTIGNVEERKETKDIWGYEQSYGLGFYEYFQICEDIGAIPVPVVNAGMTCQGGVHGGVSEYMADMNGDLDSYIQDAVDLVEYCNGDENTTWGKKRIEAGHKKPFNLKYLAIGNEQWGDEYHKRFEAFQKVLKEKCPDITLIAASGPVATGIIPDTEWKWIRSNAKGSIVDEHYYMSPDWFLLNTDRYDSYDRSGNKVFLGEYASQSNTLKSALAEGAYLTGLEKNSDIVKMASYAPLFAKSDDYQWSPNMIWFNGDTNYVTPNYYVQKLFSTNLGTQMLKQELVKPKSTVTNYITGGLVLGAWSTQVQYDNVKITNNDTGEQLFSDNFDGDMSKWNVLGGNWTVKDGQLTLDQIADNCRIQTKDTNYSNYTLEVDAKKNGGNEGFLVGFGAKDSSNYYWLNVGGWGNTTTAIEKSVNGAKSTISTTDSKYGSVTTGKDYKIKIVVNGNRISCYINGELTNEVTEKVRDTDIYTSTSYDEKTKDLILKVVNVSDESKNVKINLNGKRPVNSKATVEYITGDDSSITNSFDNPDKISIKTKKLDNISKSFDYNADKYSVSVMRIKLK